MRRETGVVSKRVAAPPGQPMGHAGAISAGGKRTRVEKVVAMRAKALRGVGSTT